MNKIFVLCFTLAILSCPVFASEITDISMIEKDLFGVEYKDENIQNRLVRIEKHLYGKANSGTNKDRINKIAETSGISFAPKIQTEPQRTADFESEDNTVSYPVIDMMEEKLFNRNYQGENVYNRVARLEQKAFGKASQGELSERTDKLKAELLAVKQQTNEILDDYQTHKTASLPKNNYYNYNIPNNNYLGQTYSYTQNNPPFDSEYGYSTGGAANLNGYGADFDYALTAAENLVFGKNYSGKTDLERLNKLENKIFKKTFSGDKVTRLERVVSAATAKNSSNIYRENKFEKYLSAGMQVGAVLLMILAMVL